MQYIPCNSALLAQEALFLPKKALFMPKDLQKKGFIGQEVHYQMVYIAYFTELILKICDYAQKRRI